MNTLVLKLSSTNKYKMHTITHQQDKEAIHNAERSLNTHATNTSKKSLQGRTPAHK